MSSSGYEPSAKLPHHVEQISLPCPLNGCHGKWKSKYIQVEQGNQPALHWWSGFKLGLKLGYFYSKCWVSNCGTERITRVHCKVVGQRDAQFIAGALVPQYNISFDQSTPAAPLLEFVQNMLKGPRNYFTPSVNSKTKTDKVKRTHNLWPYQVGWTELPASLSGRSHPQTLIPTHQQTIIPRARKSWTCSF